MAFDYRIKPLQVLYARRMYENGRTGDPSWVKNPQVVKALDWAFDSSIKVTRN